MLNSEKITSKVLVATPAYNAESTICRLAESIEMYPGVTWLVRDDGSTDNTLEELQKIKKYKNIDIKLYSGPNMGLTYGRNFLSYMFVNEPEFSEFTHMVFVDADDFLNPGWLDQIEYWINYVSNKFPNEKSPYLCFQYWDLNAERNVCSYYTKLCTRRKDHMYVNQYPDGGVDVLHVIPKEYLREVKEFDGNYYHVVKDEKWSPCMYNFLAYTDYPASFISSTIATVAGKVTNMSATYYDNIVTTYAQGQIDETIMYLDKYSQNGGDPVFDWTKVPAHRYRWLLKCLVRMIKNGTLVRSDKRWSEYRTPSCINISNKPK